MTTVPFSTKFFFEVYFKTVDDFHAQGKAPATDCALMYLFQKYKNKLVSQNYIGEDPSGFSFHKGFRQECIADEAVATSIWFLLQDAPLFWAVMEAKRALTPDPNMSRDDYKAKGY